MLYFKMLLYLLYLSKYQNYKSSKCIYGIKNAIHPCNNEWISQIFCNFLKIDFDICI